MIICNIRGVIKKYGQWIFIATTADAILIWSNASYNPIPWDRQCPVWTNCVLSVVFQSWKNEVVFTVSVKYHGFRTACQHSVVYSWMQIQWLIRNKSGKKFFHAQFSIRFLIRSLDTLCIIENIHCYHDVSKSLTSHSNLLNLTF